MPVYEEPSKEMMILLEKYLNKNEICKVSGSLELNDKIYKEIIFFKKTFFKNEKTGFLYVDEYNNFVHSKNIQNELAKLGHYYELFYSEDKTYGFISALLNMEGLERTNEDIKDIIKGLDFLKSQGVENTENIKNVSIKLLELRLKINEAVEKISDLVNQMQYKPFNKEKIQILYPLYEEILKLNFQKVKLISTLENYLDYVKKMAEKKKRRFHLDLIKI